jgi:hypothetical protein
MLWWARFPAVGNTLRSMNTTSTLAAAGEMKPIVDALSLHAIQLACLIQAGLLAASKLIAGSYPLCALHQHVLGATFWPCWHNQMLMSFLHLQVMS